MWRNRSTSLLAASIGALALAVAAIGTTASADPSPLPVGANEVADPGVGAPQRAISSERGRTITRALTAAKLAAALGALGVVAFGRQLRRRGRAGAYRRIRSGLLLLLALFAFAASYNFFAWRHDHGIHVHEFFHYYLGAKYFPELGYHALYECAVAAATEKNPGEAARPHEIRDLRHVERRIQVVPARSLEGCRARFTPERWASFGRDTAFLKQRMTPERWARVLTDQGLNASPVWLIAGHSLAEWVPTEPDALRRYARLDLVILAIGFAAVGLAFGLDGLSLAMLAWAANPLGGYGWVGDTPLRQLWFGALLVGLSLLRRGRYGAAAIFLATSSLARLFPIFFPLGYAARQARCWIAERRPAPGFVRFVLVGSASGLLLIALSIPATGRGVAVIGEFVDEMSSYSTLTGRNSMGLQALLTYSTTPVPPRLVAGQLEVLEADQITHAQRTFRSRRPIYWAGLGLMLLLYWRALSRAEDWEAACLGFVLVLVLTQAASYYMTCTVGAALLGTRRPRIAIALLGALVAWGGITLALADSADGFALATVVALLLSVYTLVEMRRPADDDRDIAAGSALDPSGTRDANDTESATDRAAR